MGVAVGVIGLGCQGRADEVSKLGDVRTLVRQRMPAVARATGLEFKREPTVARRTRAEIRDYAIGKLDEEYPPAEVAGYESALRLFGLIPDTVDLRSALMRVLGEQIAGYYDPDSSTLYVASDVADSFALRTTISHELAHALQHQYLNLDSLISQKRQQDRSGAAKALLEGQATLAQTLVMMPEQGSLDQLPSFVETWSALDQQQSQMKEFQNAPLWLRESLVFPYLAGADFVVWYKRRHGDQQPYGAAMPVSTEQILHPDRYDAGDVPTDLVISGGPAGASVRYEDGLGEFEIRVLFKLLLPDASGLRAAALAAGWDGDRYQVLTTATRDALVWYSVWDDAAAADRFARSLERVWPNRRRDAAAPRRVGIERVTIDGVPGVRLVDAPVGWNGWSNLPVARVRR